MSAGAKREKGDSRSLDYYGGVLMVVIGLGSIWRGVEYQVGTLTQMGAGYFPVGIGSVLALMGLSILVGAWRLPISTRKKWTPEWRGWSCIVLALVAFVLVGRFGGLVPATFAVTFIAAIGDRKNTFWNSLLLSIAMVAVSVVVFSWALQMQFPLFRWG
jgi:hypothetical protein